MFELIFVKNGFRFVLIQVEEKIFFLYVLEIFVIDIPFAFHVFHYLKV